MTQFVTDDLPGPLGAVVHIGAGRGTAVSAYRAAGATRIVLVEPDPEAAAQLRSRLASTQNVSLVTAAIVGVPDAGGTTLLNRFSFAELNALRAPTGLLEIFPGLETLAPAEVATLTPSALIEAHLPILPATGPEVDVDEADRPIDVLVLEAPGEALAILETLEQDGHLARFGRIIVQEGRKQLYEGAAPIDRVVTFLKTAGFAAPLYDRADPDRPTLRTDRDPEADTLTRLIRERDDLLGQRDAANAEMEALRSAHADTLNRLARERDSLVAQQKAIEDSHALTSVQQAQDLHERASQIIVLESALREQSAESTRLLNVLAETEMRLDLCRRTATDLQVREKIVSGQMSEAAKLIDAGVTDLQADASPSSAQVRMLKVQVDLMNHALTQALQRDQLSSRPNSDAGKTALERSSKAQLGQDLWVLERTKNKRGGYFVEFGATDGILLSNTFMLEKDFGWTGLCAEPNPKFFSRLEKNRNCTVSPACILGKSGEKIDFVLADEFGSAVRDIDHDKHADKRRGFLEAGEVISLTSISLDDFLKEHGAPRDIDYLSIDTEGSEYEILRHFPFQDWRVRLITVEHNFTANRDNIHDLLTANGYRRTEMKWDDWYELEDYIQTTADEGTDDAAAPFKGTSGAPAARHLSLTRKDSVAKKKPWSKTKKAKAVKAFIPACKKDGQKIERLIRSFYQRQPNRRVMIDGGAHMGFHSLFAAGVFSNRIIGVEANVETYVSLIKSRMSKTGVDGNCEVLAVNAALGSREKQGDTVAFFRSSSHPGRSTVNTKLWERWAEGSVSYEPPVVAPVVEIDDLTALYAGGHPVDFIKLDLEGNEINALRGGERTLRDYRPAIVMEFGLRPDIEDLFGETLSDFSTLLEHLGYRAFAPWAEDVTQSLLEGYPFWYLFLLPDDDDLDARLALLEDVFRKSVKE